MNKIINRLQLLFLPLTCYWQNLRETWKEGIKNFHEDANFVLAEKEIFQRGTIPEENHEEQEPKVKLPKINPKDIIVIPADFDFSSLSEDDRISLISLIASGRVIEVTGLHSVASIK